MFPSHVAEQQRRNFEGTPRCPIASKTTFFEGRRDPGETHQGWIMVVGFKGLFLSQNQFK